MRTRFWSYCSLVILLCLLFTVNSRGKEVVPVTEHHTSLLPTVPQAENDPTHVISAKTNLASGFYGISRRQHVPVSVSERYPGTADIPAFSFECRATRSDHTPSLYNDAGNIFISRIRSLLYPKHSFW